MKSASATPSGTVLTQRFREALEYAFNLHSRQRRKGSGVPYIAHLLGVTALVLEDGGSEDEAIAALLHDAVEDQGGLAVLEQIRSRFGDQVAEIVDGCTDAYTSPKPPWQERKEGYILRLRSEGPKTRRVSLADKVHNARALLSDIRQDGATTWQRFNGGREGTLWYYRTLAEVFRQVEQSPMVDELTRLVEQIEELASEEDHE